MKLLTWFAGLAVLGVLLFFLSRSEPPKQVAAAESVKSAQRKAYFAGNSPAARTPPRGGLAAHKRNVARIKLDEEEVKRLAAIQFKKADELMARAAEFRTPEWKATLVDAMIRSRTSKYSELFDSWDLDSATSERALAIIRARETELMDRRTELLKAGMSGVFDFNKQKKVEKTLAEIQLMTLLGPDRVTQLTKVEDEMELQVQADAKEVLRKGKMLE
jgi:hypothetical protein